MSLKLGIIGATGHVNYIFKGLDERPDVQVVAIAPGCSGESIERLRKKLGNTPGLKEYEDYRALLDKAGCDLVGVSPPYYRHAEVSGEALRRGIPVFCEKPLALKLDSLDTLRSIQQKSGAPVSLMLDYRYSPAFHTARRLVTEGAIGEPTIGYAQKSYRRGNRPEFYKQRETFGGIIPWVGIHAIDWFAWVAGQEYRSVMAQHVKLGNPEYPAMEDGATCLFTLGNGATAVMSFDFLRPQGSITPADDRLRLIGQRGALEIRGRDQLELINGEETLVIEPDLPPRGIFADFVHSLVDQTAATISTEDAFNITEVALKCRESADTGKLIELGSTRTTMRGGTI